MPSYDDLASITVLIVSPVIVLCAYLLWRSRPWHLCQDGVHQFTPRYDTVFVSDKWRTIYVRDVCGVCGKTIERAENAESAAE